MLQRKPTTSKFLALGAATAVLAACGGGDSQLNPQEFVYSEMRTEYLWDEFVEDGNPNEFDSPAAVLNEFKRTASQGLDDKYSFTINTQVIDSFLNDGQDEGSGARFGFSGNQLRAVYVTADSPADAAGLRRGAVIERINGSTPTPQNAGSLLGGQRAGTQVTMQITDADGSNRRNISYTNAIYTIDSTQVVQRFTTASGQRVGYLLFSDFFGEKSQRELRAAFDELNGDGSTPAVDELILDLRYNGGGRVSTSIVLASLLAGRAEAGNLFQRAVQNDNPNRREDYSFELDFVDEPEALTLNRVYVITTGGTASASEGVINGLEPYMDVVTIGSNTFGKPVGQFPKGIPGTDLTLALVHFKGVNADGFGDFFNGIPPDCGAQDDWDRPLFIDGDTGNEASIQVALNAISGPGTCGTSTVGQSKPAPQSTQQLLDTGHFRGWMLD